MNHETPLARRSSWSTALTVLATLLVPTTARAQADPQRTAAAVVLYEQAASAMDAKDYARACPKLEEAVRLEPSALGARMTLAACYEGQGKLASAWSTYLAVEDAAARANQPERQAKAHERIEALRPRLSRLRIVVSDQVKVLPGLAIRRDGQPVGPAQWEEGLPVDPGRHEIIVEATGKARFEKVVDIHADRTDAVVEISALSDTAAKAAPAPKKGGGPDDRVRMLADKPGVILYKIKGTFVGGATADPLSFIPVPVCELPCAPSQSVLWGHELYFGGEGIADSSEFVLREKAQNKVLLVTTGTTAKYAGGIALTGFGGVGTLAGAILHASAERGTISGGLQNVLGILVFVPSLPMLIVGIVNTYTGRTRYTLFDDPNALQVRF